MSDLDRRLAEALDAIDTDAILAAVLKASFFESCQRDENGRCRPGTGGGKNPTAKPGGKQKPIPVRPGHTPGVFGASEQRHAERQQDHLADAIDRGAEAIPGSAPSDVERVERDGSLTCLEVKTKLRGKSVRMTAAAQARKLRRLEQHRAETGKGGSFHTVAVDHRQAYRTEADFESAPTFPCYYRRGGGSFTLAEMERVETPERLEQLLTMPDAELPPKARPTTAGLWGRYNATRSAQGRQKLIRQALARERQRTRAKKT